MHTNNLLCLIEEYMKFIGFLTAMILPLSNAYSATSKQACDILKGVVADLQEQVPMSVDYMTTLTGVQAIYASGRCLLNYTYVVDSEILLKEMMMENELSREENLFFLKTDEGRETLEQVVNSLAQNAAPQFESLSNVKGMKVTYMHTFDNFELKPIVSTLLQN